jgi:hypothetical protein
MVVGPPEPETPAEFLAAQQRPVPQKAAPIQDLWPILLAQAADLGSTEYALRKAGPALREGSPNPLMGTTPGRIGMSLAEMLAIHFLTRRNPKARKILKITSGVGHGGAAIHNLIRAGTIDDDR